MDRRSRSTSTSRHHDPYHAVSEVYTKEITHRPIGPASEYPPEILNILREEPRAPHSPPLVRSRENTWTPENFPIVRVPSAQFTDIMTELYDYHEVEKYTRRSMTPEPLHRQQEIVERAPPPTYHVIPPTPEKNTPRVPGGIPLTSPPEPPKKPLPMYEEYVKMQKENQENRNNIPIPRPRSRSPLVRSGSDARNNNNEILRHIDSSSSSSDSFVDHEKSKSLSLKSEPQFVAREPPRPSEPTFVKPEDIGKRYVYSHDVYVDSATGRPFTPGREDMKDKKSCDKLKINVYFKPPHPPVEETYKLDEIEIEKQEDILVSKLRPFENSILSRRPSSQPSVSPLPIIPPADSPISSEMEHRRIPTRTTVLRKEHEILTMPLNRSQSVRQSRVSEHSTRRSASRTVTERSIPIHLADDKESIDMDEIFPKMPHHQTVTNVHDYPQSRSSTRSHGAASHGAPSHGVGSIDKGDVPRHRPTLPKKLRPESVQSGTPVLPLTRGLSKTPSDKDYRLKEDYKVKRPSERSPSFVSSHAPSHKTERTPSEVRIPITVATSKPPQKRESPEELDYGRFQSGKPEQVKELSPTRGISKTPSDKDFQKYNPSKDAHIPYNNPEKERAYQQQLLQEKPKDVHIPYNNPEKERAYQQQQLGPKSIPSVRSSYRSQHTSQSQKGSETPELPFTRGLTRTPSDKDVQSVTTQPEKPKEVHVPYNNPEKERAYQQAHGPKRVPSGSTHSPSKRTRSPGSKHRPSASHSGPFEEIVHIKERYERDETIRRFFPTTTTV